MALTSPPMVRICHLLGRELKVGFLHICIQVLREGKSWNHERTLKVGNDLANTFLYLIHQTYTLQDTGYSVAG